jgi:glutamate--cysteine ligase
MIVLCVHNDKEETMATSDHEDLIETFAGQLLTCISGKLAPAVPRTYGFEYEFLAREAPTSDCVRKMHGCLAEMGFTWSGKYLENSRGMHVTFEPGGQIEYHSKPLPAGADAEFDDTLREIDAVNDAIRWECGVDYLPVPYMAGRGEGPLCLTSERYVNLHNRLAVSGTRGHEMMKGTASIHLHARILTLAEMPALFALMSVLAERPEFRMGPDRRDIWNNADPTRCGMPYLRPDAGTTAHVLCRDIVRVGMAAVVLGARIPFGQTGNPTFESFLYHLTTLFTDVRLNMSAPTLELRTLDAIPAEDFKGKWRLFVEKVETFGGAL